MYMNLKTYIFFIVFIVISASQVACKSDVVIKDSDNITKPNVILIIADDMGLDATPGYTVGNIKPKMPNLEALQKNGLTFNNFNTNPLCSPTRATIISGKYGFKTGVLTVNDVLSNSETILQKYISQNTQNSYSTAVIGKWHLAGNSTSFNPETLGIDYYAGVLSGGLSSYTNWTMREDGNAISQTTYSTEKFTDLAKTWIGQQSKPFFLWLAYNAPHAPFHVPPAQMHNQGNLSQNSVDINGNPLPYYLASIEAMDYQIGKLMESLTIEQRANTIVIFMGDNGTPNQVAQTYNRNKVKNTVYQGGINTPLVISGSGVERIGVDNALINSVDLFATIAALCGVDVEEYNDSKNFTSLLKTSTKLRDFTYSEVKDNAVDEHAIRTAKYKLIIKTDGSEEFYDLEKDPFETNNLNNKLSTEEKTTKSQLWAELQRIRTK
jgi:arylsulfatase B